MSEQPTIIKQAEDVVGKVAASVAETLNFSDKEAPAASNPGKLSKQCNGQVNSSPSRPTHCLH
jgi:hypothetical protein